MLDQFLIVQAIYTVSIMALVACNLYQSSRAKKMETALRQATSAMHSALEMQEQSADKDLDG